MAKAQWEAERMQNNLALQDADHKVFTQKLAQLNKELKRDNDSVLSSKTKVRLEAQII